MRFLIDQLFQLMPWSTVLALVAIAGYLAYQNWAHTKETQAETSHSSSRDLMNASAR